MGYPLQQVLDLRRREEEAAAMALGNATRELQQAEAAGERRHAQVAAARQRWENAAAGGEIGRPSHDGASPPLRGLDVAARARFAERLRHELHQVEAELRSFRTGPLAARRAAENTARDRHLSARRATKLIEKHEAAFAVGLRRAAEQRDDEAREDMARAVRSVRGAR